MEIRRAEVADFEGIWPILEGIARAGNTYAYPRDITREAAFNLWITLPSASYVAAESGQIVGSYYLKPNQAGGGAHVCNAGYIVAEAARGRGVGRALCLDSQREAVKLGFKAMQFNLVVATNPALKLWRLLDFSTIGTLPKAFRHPQHGLVDAFVMYKWLTD